MWVRKRLEIGGSHLLYGLARCLVPGSTTAHQQSISAHLPQPSEAVLTLSVRSGFDLLLSALCLPRGSEILFSALTLPDMATIARAHHLVPVPVDLDPSTAGPDLESLRSAIRPQTKALVVAHLFGSRVDLTPIVEICRHHGLLLIEDGAQAFTSARRWGDDRCDVSLFSFGSIKTATAAGGGILQVRDPSLRERMKEHQALYPLQSVWQHTRKLSKIALFKSLSFPVPYRILRQFCQLVSIPLDPLLQKSMQGFRGSQCMSRFRHRPHPALLALLRHRLATLDPRQIRQRTLQGRRLRDHLTKGSRSLPGEKARVHSFWVFPVLANVPATLIQDCLKQGFDATSQQSMAVLPSPPEHPGANPSRARTMLEQMLYLPAYPEIPQKEIDALARRLGSHRRA
ncbi:MAG: aminotransferase class V-fold PLP-dependent enzyme [Verrucomicrobiota bacterium]